MLSSEEQAQLREWVELGAAFPDDSSHWAFRPLAQHSHVATKERESPLLRAQAAAQNIDSLLAEIRAQNGIPSSLVASSASNRVLVQRIYLDLTGLPPSTAQLQAAERPTKSGWYSDLVEELLADESFGLRWSQLWLDLARYADSDGFEKDLVRPDAWTYRKWVIDSLNANLPFDKFSQWQLAGDCLEESTLEQRIATGFLRCSPANREGGTDPLKNDFERDVDRHARRVQGVGFARRCR